MFRIFAEPLSAITFECKIPSMKLIAKSMTVFILWISISSVSYSQGDLTEATREITSKSGDTLSHDEQLKRDFLTKWRNSEQYLKDLIGNMSEHRIDFKPVESSKSFSETVVHMVSNMVWLSTDYFEGGGFDSGYKIRTFTKETLLDLVDQAFGYSYSAVENYDVKGYYVVRDFFAGPMNNVQILRLMNDHMSHHKGQLTVYLKMNGQAVPRYIGW